MSAGSTQARLIARRGRDFYVVQSMRTQVDGHLENITQRYGPFSGAFFDPTMAAPGGPNTEIQDIRDDSGWRVNFMPLVIPANSPNGVPGNIATMSDNPKERDSIDGLSLGWFWVLKVTPIGNVVDGQAESYRAILERQT